MRKIEGLLLDVDGTLIDSNDAHAHAWMDALTESGVRPQYKDVRDRIGMGGDNILPLVAKVSLRSKEGQAIESLRRTIFHNRYLKTIRPFPFAQQLLEVLNTLGFKLVVASSAVEEDLLALLRQTGLYHLIDDYTSSSDIEFSKPNPDLVFAALEKMQLPASKVLMLGDTPYDIEAASKAGVDTIAFTCGGRKAAELAGAIRIYRDPESFLHDLRKNNTHALDVRGYRGISENI
jgi:HAD superfamily hydrolase (TIGR01549 family)